MNSSVFEAVTTSVERRPRFYGFEPAADGLSPRERSVVYIHAPTPRVYRFLLTAAEDALHDHPLPCGARPAELVPPRGAP